MLFYPIILLSLSLFFCASATAKSAKKASDAEGPLDLTAYLERGEVDKARKLSAVDPTLFAGVQSHAAFFNVNKTNKWHNFFWFFPAENKPLDSTPWILWLGSTVGTTDLFDLFGELGPLQIENMTAFRQSVTLNSDYSLLYIDNPVQVGFSYSEEEDNLVKNEYEGGQCLLSFIQQFLQVFPELQKAPLFIAGEYFGARTGLALGRNIHYRENSSVSINLKGFLFNTPWVDPPSYLHYSELASQLGFIDFGVAAEMKKTEEAARKAWNEGNIREYLMSYADVNEMWMSALNYSVSPAKFTEDINKIPYIPKFVAYVNQSNVRSALHVGDVAFDYRSCAVFHAIWPVYYLSAKTLLEDLLEHYSVLCYTGQLGFQNGYALSEHMYRDLKWSGAQNYLNATRIQINSDHPHQTLNPIGYSKGAGNFVEVMIRAAGGMSPFGYGQPLVVKQVIGSFIEKFKLIQLCLCGGTEPSVRESDSHLAGFFCSSVIAESINADGPLDLTAYLERGEADKARKLSAVDPTYFAGVQSYAAFFIVNKTNKWHSFFWFFPAENKPLDSTPWILWLGDGFGYSALWDLFGELGPLQVKNMIVSRSPVTLNSDYALLYVDNPAHVGFSYSEKKNKFVKTDDEGGEFLFSFIQQFLQVFPELQKAPLFIAGNYYAPRYGLALGRDIHYNQNSSVSINLKGFLFQTAWIDPPSYLHYSDLASQLGLLDFGEAAELKKNEDLARKAWKEGNVLEYRQFYVRVMEQLFTNPLFSMYVNVEKFTEDVSLPFIVEYQLYLNQSNVRSAIHVGDLEYRVTNYDISYKLRHVYYLSAKPLLEDLLEHYGVLCYTGQLEFLYGYALSEHMYRDLKWSGAQDYLNATRKQIFNNNPTVQTLRPIGFAKGDGNFVEVMLRSAGGYLPTGQPHQIKQVVDMFIEKFT